MVARVRTVAFEGVDVRPVDAQVQVSGGRPALAKVGPITLGNWQFANLLLDLWPPWSRDVTETARTRLSQTRTISFIRFVVARLDADSGRRTGLFQAAADLRERADLAHHDREVLESIAAWFRENLERPTNLSISKRSHGKEQALSWFKDTALEHIKRMREMERVLEEHGVRVAVISTNRPGYVTYEDEFQIAAYPFSDTPT